MEDGKYKMLNIYEMSCLLETKAFMGENELCFEQQRINLKKRYYFQQLCSSTKCVSVPDTIVRTETPEMSIKHLSTKSLHLYTISKQELMCWHLSALCDLAWIYTFSSLKERKKAGCCFWNAEE